MGIDSSIGTACNNRICVAWHCTVLQRGLDIHDDDHLPNRLLVKVSDPTLGGGGDGGAPQNGLSPGANFSAR